MNWSCHSRTIVGDCKYFVFAALGPLWEYQQTLFTQSACSPQKKQAAHIALDLSSFHDLGGPGPKRGSLQNLPQFKGYIVHIV